MLTHCDTDVIQCGFAFPTLDDYPSLPFAAAMQVLTGPDAPREGIAVVAPAGNEESAGPYWPAALPDVIGVASTNTAGEARAWFSNWGQWCDCCTRGEHVFSTFIYWDGPIDGEPLSDNEKFTGWAQMGRHVVRRPKGVGRDREAGRGRAIPASARSTPGPALVGGRESVATVIDTTLSGPPGVPLPHLQSAARIGRDQPITQASKR